MEAEKTEQTTTQETKPAEEHHTEETQVTG